MTQIVLPLTEEQAQACASAALAFGVEAWEIAVHILADVQRTAVIAGIRSPLTDQSVSDE